MEMALPTGNAGRVTALGITLLLLAVIWFSLVQTSIDLYGEGAERLAHDRLVLARMEQLAASLPALKAQQGDQRQRGQRASITIEGGSDAIAAANLQSRLQDMATGAGGSVTSFETVPATAATGGYRRIGMRLTIRAPWTVLVALLRNIEESATPMLVDEIEIHSLPSIGLPGVQKLETSFSVYAFRADKEQP
jgi:general secretion pathway protein M